MWSVTLTICETPDGSPALVGYSRCIRMGSLSDSIGVVTDVERIRSFSGHAARRVRSLRNTR